jgi:hypothetical protein
MVGLNPMALAAALPSALEPFLNTALFILST